MRVRVCVKGGGGGGVLLFKMRKSSSFIRLFVNKDSFGHTGTQNLFKSNFLSCEIGVWDLKMWTLISV